MLCEGFRQFGNEQRIIVSGSSAQDLEKCIISLEYGQNRCKQIVFFYKFSAIFVNKRQKFLSK